MKSEMREGDFKKAVKEANMFRNAANLCREDSKDGGFFFDCIHPLTINAALASEIYLKAISIAENEGRFCATHKLQDLFDCLSYDAKNVIKRDFESCMSTPLDKVLQLDNAAFLEWRYTFEINDNKKSAVLDIYGLLTLVDCLKRYVNSLEGMV